MVAHWRLPQQSCPSFRDRDGRTAVEPVARIPLTGSRTLSNYIADAGQSQWLLVRGILETRKAPTERSFDVKHLLAPLVIVLLLSSPAHSEEEAAFSADAGPKYQAGDAPRQAVARDPGASTFRLPLPDEITLSGICGLVSSQIPLRDPHQDAPAARYLYQYQLQSLAEIRVGDTPELIASKMQAYWRENNHHLTCDTSGFNVPNGYLLKFAVARRSDQFLNDMLRVWRVDLNWVDPADGRTTLDYIRDERQRSPSPAVIRVMDRYYRNFRAAGALHREELP